MITRVVTRSSNGNVLYYGLTMIVEFKNLVYPKVISHMTQFQSDFRSLPTFFFQFFKIKDHLEKLPLVDIPFPP